jgi:hypothetical protein
VTIILVSLSINYVVLVISIKAFDDKWSAYKSIRVEESLPAVYSGPKDYLDCEVTSEDRKSAVCRFDDFRNVYMIRIQGSVVTEKSYRDRIDMTRRLLPLSNRVIIIFSILAISAVAASVWYVFPRQKQTSAGTSE